MQLPPALRAAIDRELEGIALTDLARASDRLSQRYRAETRDGGFHLDDELAARAYLATRMPATYAAVAAAFTAVAEARPDFQPETLLDVGAGPGTATWAATVIWRSITCAGLIEGSPAVRAVGERLSSGLMLEGLAWRAERVDMVFPGVAPSDLVVMAYVLGELEAATRAPLIARLWDYTADTFVLVEPGTTEGWKRILAARDQLLAAGAHILAPCPHGKPCPLAPPDWCHFSARVARSRRHREAKGGSVPWEDEKFTYLAAARHPAPERRARVLAPPRVAKSGVALKLCLPDGTGAERMVPARSGSAFKRAKKLRWGDLVL